MHSSSLPIVAGSWSVHRPCRPPEAVVVCLCVPVDWGLIPSLDLFLKLLSDDQTFDLLILVLIC